MNKARILRSALCMTSAITVIVAAKAVPAEASYNNTVNSGEVTLVNNIAEYSNNSLAGISLSLDKYYSFGMDDSVELFNDDKKDSGLAALGSSVVNAPKADTTAEASPAPTATPAPAPVSKYANIGISIADNYVNIRKEASTDSEIVGKLYTGAAATITKEGKKWVKVESGKVKGYIMKEYLAIGDKAEKLVNKYGTKIATVNATTIRLREKASTDSRTLALLPKGESYKVSKTNDKWAKVSVEGVVGYLAKEFIDIDVKFDHAVSIEEEQRAAEEAAAAAEAAREERNRSNNSSNNSSNDSDRRTSRTSRSSSRRSGSGSGSGSSGSSAYYDEDDYSGGVSGRDVVAYAKRFLGNRYVYGGNSLTRGTDCSGFTKLVYGHFGYRLNRTSGGQRRDGRRVSLSSLKAGDLICYSGHVAMYIGGGKVIHASNERTGIIISGIYYSGRPICARRIIN